MPLIDYKFFVNPFGVDGDLAVVPDALQPSGTVSYDQGFGSDYAKDLEDDPDALPIPRAQFNQLLFDATKAIRHYQSLGIPNFITSTKNLGTPFSYSKFALALFDDGSGIKVFQSLEDANTTDPTDLTKWRVVPQSESAVILDTVAFDVAVANGDAVYWDTVSSTYKKAIADGTSKQQVVGFADVTYKRIFALGLFPGLTGLTPGAIYYLSSSVAGAITTTRPATNAVQVGKAFTTTFFFVATQATSAATAINIVKFLSSGTYTPSPNLLFAIVEVQAPGGGGGGCEGTAGQAAGAGGGGGGGYGKSLLTPLDIGASKAVTIGAPGVGGAAGANDGADGGNTSFGALITCTGGKGGKGAHATPAASGNDAGTGGSSSGANVENINGASGLPGFTIDAINTFGGSGGGTQKAGAQYGVPNAFTPAGNDFGGGGPGAFKNNATSTALAGADGGKGIVIITEYLGS